MSERRKQYPFDIIEPKWQNHWDNNNTFKSLNPQDENFDPSAPKYYALDMFPYPSGQGLHVGHPEGYTATDIICRYKRMLGFNVLHPMGWDAFGLPAEQYAIEHGIHPRETTEKNVTYPGISQGNVSTKSIYEDKGVKKIMKGHFEVGKKFREFEFG